MQRLVALLRGINVGAHTKLPMAELRGVAEGLRWANVATYIQSGNLVFESTAPALEAETALESAIQNRFGMAVPVLVRTSDAWAEYRAGNPFPEAATEEPNRLMLCLTKLPPADGAGAAIQERARDEERVAQVGAAIWIHYPGGAGTSRLSPSLLNRLAGSPLTARNWRTVLKIGEMLGL